MLTRVIHLSTTIKINNLYDHPDWCKLYMIGFVCEKWCEMEEWENRLLAVHMLENRHANAWVDRNVRRANVRCRVRCENITVDGDSLR